jgi:hypothetical protein
MEAFTKTYKAEAVEQEFGGKHERTSAEKGLPFQKTGRGSAAGKSSNTVLGDMEAAVYTPILENALRRALAGIEVKQ